MPQPRQRAVDLLRRRAFLDQELRLVHVGEHHAVADEARAVAHDDADLAEPLRERQRGGETSGDGGVAAHDLEQPHHVRRAEEVQPDDALRTRNVELTYPYFHDGAAPTLEEAVDTMGRLQLGHKFTKDENAKIVAFLKTLTGKQPDIKLPILPPSTNETPRPKPFD